MNDDTTPIPTHDDLLRAVETAQQEHHRAIMDVRGVQEQMQEQARAAAMGRPTRTRTEEEEQQAMAFALLGDDHDPAEIGWNPPPVDPALVPDTVQPYLHAAEETAIALCRAQRRLALHELRMAAAAETAAEGNNGLAAFELAKEEEALAAWAENRAGVLVDNLRRAVERWRLADHPAGVLSGSDWRAYRAHL